MEVMFAFRIFSDVDCGQESGCRRHCRAAPEIMRRRRLATDHQPVSQLTSAFEATCYFASFVGERNDAVVNPAIFYKINGKFRLCKPFDVEYDKGETFYECF